MEDYYADIPNKVILSAACFTFLTQVLLELNAGLGEHAQSWSSIFAWIVLAAVAWFPFYGELFYLSIFLFITVISGQNPELLPLVGAYATLIALIQNRHGRIGLLFLSSIEGYQLYIHSFSKVQIRSSALAVFTVVVIGMTLASMRKSIYTYKRRTEEIEKAYLQLDNQLRSKMARYLHDTVAKDMAQINVIAERAMMSGAASKELETIMEIGKRASLRIRPQILGSEAYLQETSCKQAIEQSAKLLEVRSLKLIVEGEEELEILTHEQCTLASLFINEVLMNVLKYAAPHTDVFLLIQRIGKKLEITCSNQIAAQASLKAYSNGTGLKACQQQFENVGGTTSFARTSDTWISLAVLPLTSRTARDLDV